jgi:hypothetical protein
MFGLAIAAVLGQEPEMGTELLAIHPWPVETRRGATHMHELGTWIEHNAPPRLADAVAEVNLFVEHEETGVEDADLVDDLATDKEYRADQEFCIPHR